MDKHTQLKQQMARAKIVCKEVYVSIKETESFLQELYSIHNKYRVEYEKADRELAFYRIKPSRKTKDEKVTVDISIRSMSMDDILELAGKLGISIHGEEDDGAAIEDIHEPQDIEIDEISPLDFSS